MGVALRRLWLCGVVAALLAGVMLAAGASATSGDGLLVFHRYASCLPDGPGCYDAVYVANTNGTGVRRLADNGTEPVWSPDGSKIAYQSVGDGIFVMNADGTGKRQIRREADFSTSSPAWAPDGLRIAFGYADPHGHLGVGILNVDGTHLRLVPGTRKLQVTGLDWSPDGKRLAFEAGFGHIYVINLDGSRLKLVAKDAESPRWSPDGKTILFAKNDGTGISLVGAGGGTPRLIRKTPTNGSVHYATWSSDGTRIAFFDGHRSNTELHILDLANGRDRIIRLQPRVCTGDYTCYYPDWQQSLPTR